MSGDSSGHDSTVDQHSNDINNANYTIDNNNKNKSNDYDYNYNDNHNCDDDNTTTTTNNNTDNPYKKWWQLLRSKLIDGFTSLRNSPSELYKVYALKFLDSYSYFSFSIIFTLFLSDDFGYTDIQAGIIYGMWGMMITVYGFCTGFLVDNFGVSKSLKVGYGLSLVARCGIFITTSRTMLLFHLYGSLPLGNCLGIPVLMTGIRRYTHEGNRGFAFGIFYVVMNIAALISGPVVDILTIWYKGGGNGGGDHDGDSDGGGDVNATATIPITKSWSLTSYRAIILSGIVANVVAFLITFTVREIKVDDPYQQQQQQQPQTQEQEQYKNDGIKKRYDEDDISITNNSNCNDDGDGDGEKGLFPLPPLPVTSGGTRGITVFQPKTGSPWKILSEIFQSSSFRQYLVVILIMLNVRQIFRHLDATWPKYMVREFGPDVKKGTIYAINPILIIILVPIVSAMTAHVDPLIMIHWGSYVSAGSVFFLVLAPTSIWASVLFMIVLSVGEALWSPRLNDYTVSVSEEGREGTYMALASAPLFLAKLPVGVLSGVLLERYCPETLEEGQERHSGVMWLIIGSLTATSPILLTCCWNYVSKKHNNNHNTDEFQGGVRYTELRPRTMTPQQ